MFRIIGVEDGVRGGTCLPPQKKLGNFFGQLSCKIQAFSGKYHAIFRNFVNFMGKCHKNSSILIFFSGKCHVKFGLFVNFSCIIFGQKYLAPKTLTELLHYAYV